jgi:hypothetical protein
MRPILGIAALASIAGVLAFLASGQLPLPGLGADGAVPETVAVVSEPVTGVGVFEALIASAREPVAENEVSELDAALKVLTLLDDGRPYETSRWHGDVSVSVEGEGLDGATLSGIDETLAWLTEITGVRFYRVSGDARLRVVLAPGAAPKAALWAAGGRINSGEVSWDPTHPWAERWRWEELIHAAGPAGDHGPGDAVLSTTQSATTPQVFDRWVLASLYAARSTSVEDLTTALEANRPQ